MQNLPIMILLRCNVEENVDCATNEISLSPPAPSNSA